VTERRGGKQALDHGGLIPLADYQPDPYSLLMTLTL
jgi:hypothetical protein